LIAIKSHLLDASLYLELSLSFTVRDRIHTEPLEPASSKRSSDGLDACHNGCELRPASEVALALQVPLPVLFAHRKLSQLANSERVEHRLRPGYPSRIDSIDHVGPDESCKTIYGDDRYSFRH
jgi:hypothetical protein